ncbi:BQ5605_C001g00146 [Microbotryum silenes-dioicae]|uniref:BQ5605_C001g00146 protein n=1 Tax=Microbotryum silenes-dioicae TaxID=796604 RepID=A0A2X0P5E0_9BASI|nr:BQ5605_C001g00146 [Microbotryum silenes-dioicae]
MLLQVLLRDQLKVDALLGQQLKVSALFGDAAVLQNVDDVRGLNCRETMRDGDRRSTFGGLVERRLYNLLGFGVECRGRFVQQQDLGVADQGTSNGDALLLTTRELRSFATDLGRVPIGQGHDKVVNVGILASSLDLLLWLLRDKRHVVTVRVDIEARDVLTIDHDVAGQGIVESFDKLNQSRFTATGGADDGDELSWLDLEIEATEYADVRSGRVTEMDVLELDVAVALGQLLAARILGVDLGARVHQVNSIGGGTSGLGHVGDIVEDIASLNGTKHNRDHGDEEGARRQFAVDELVRTVPENQADDEEGERLRDRIPHVGPKRGAVRDMHRLVEVLGVDTAAVRFPGQGSNGSDRTRCLAGHLGGLFVALLVFDVLEHNDPKSDDTGGDCDRHARNTDESKLPCVGKTNDRTSEQSN